MTEIIPLFETLDEQHLVSFTGRVNILDRLSHQLLGVVVVKEGQVFNCQYRGVQGLKAFFNVIIEGAQLVPQDFIVEPEIIEEKERHIHDPFSVLKTKALDFLKRYQAVVHLRPPGNVRLIPEEAFLTSEREVSSEEFTVLNTLTEWSSVDDLYRHCRLLDYEITEALVSLRKKEALRVIGTRLEGQ